MASRIGANANPAPRHRLFKGSGFIAGQDPGIVTLAGAPGRARVFVYEGATHVLVAVTSSDKNGEWMVDLLDENRRYYVIAFDHELRFNAVIRDNIKPAVAD